LGGGGGGGDKRWKEENCIAVSLSKIVIPIGLLFLSDAMCFFLLGFFHGFDFVVTSQNPCKSSALNV